MLTLGFRRASFPDSSQLGPHRPLGSLDKITGIPAAAAASETTWIYSSTESRRFFIIELD
jgi:hypothetical protein